MILKLDTFSLLPCSFEFFDGTHVSRFVLTARQFIGHIHDGKYGNDFITLEAHINLAAFPRKEGDSRIMVSVFDYEPKSFKGDNNDVPF